jgi:hypothetical protein
LTSCQSSTNRFTQDERGANTYSSTETGQLSSVLEGNIVAIKQTVGVPLTKFLEVINARLLAFKNILKDNAQISAIGQLIIKNILSYLLNTTTLYCLPQDYRLHSQFV